MARQKDFPLKELKSSLDNLQTYLDSAQSKFSKDKDLSDSIKQTRETVLEVNKKLKSS